MICKARGEGNGYGSSGTPQNCVFPFITGGRRYSGCATGSGGKGPWCATQVDSNGKLKTWARCNNYCKRDYGEYNLYIS